MAMVMAAFASYLSNLFLEVTVTVENLGMLGVSDEIDKMGDNLRDLRNFLADADRRNMSDASVQAWVCQLKRAMYEATDILDLCELKGMELVPSTRDAGCSNPLLFCMRHPFHAREISSRIKAFNHRLNSIKERSAAFNFINLVSYEDRHTSMVHASRPANSIHDMSGELDCSDLVGEKIEEDMRALLEMLTKNGDGRNEGNTEIMVVAIVGCGGIGKTTLAQKIFNHNIIKQKFDETIWLHIGENFNKTELLRTTIRLVGGDHEERSLAVLLPTLTVALRGRKILLVMDDVWNHGAWTDVLKIPFVKGAAQGSRVLLTTRDERAARAMKAMVPYYRINKLNHEDGWLLLKKQVLSSDIDEQDIDALKDIGLDIISKCNGLPIAIKVMGSILRMRETRRRDWEMVRNDFIQPASELPAEIYQTIFSSYENLPPLLKQCFLHYCLLPNNIEFSMNEIVGMWIAEGCIFGSSDNLEELGTKYYKELILMNLIEQDSRYAGSKVYNMNGVVRSFAQYVARDEALVAHNPGTGIIGKLSSHEFIKLSIESRGLESDRLEWRFLEHQTLLRTLILVGHFLIQPGDSLSTFSSLRTLHVEGEKFATLVDSLYELKHLRYLSIAHTDVPRLPENIGRLKFLQHISLRGCKSMVNLPSSIVKLSQLRYLSLDGSSINGIPRGFRALTNLRRLIGFPVQVDGDWCSLEELGPLSQLMALGLEGLENVSASSSAAMARLNEKVHLEELFLCCTSRLGSDELVREDEGIFDDEQRRIEKVFDELCPPPHLETLSIMRYFGRRLPRWMMSTSTFPLTSLRNIMMEDLACCTQLPDGLCQLPYLELIQINRAPSVKRVGPEFLKPYRYHNPSPSQVSAAFPKLHEMTLIGMVEWEEWEWVEQVQGMPNMEELQLRGCKLWVLPPGLAFHARALKKLCLQDVQHLNYLEHFASVVELQVIHNPDLERITNLPKLQKLLISICPKMKVLEGLPELKRLEVEDYYSDALPEYMQDTNPMHLKLLTSISAGQSGHEWEKLRYIKQVKAFADDGENSRIWYTLYKRDPYNSSTNISYPSILEVPAGKDDEVVGENEDQVIDTDKSSESTALHVRKEKDELVTKNEHQIVKAGKSSELAGKNDIFTKNEDQIVDDDNSSESADSAVYVGKDEDEVVGTNDDQFVAPVGKDDAVVDVNEDQVIDTDKSSESTVHVRKEKDELITKNEVQIVNAGKSSESAGKDDLVCKNEDQIVDHDNSSESADKEEFVSKNKDQVVDADKSSESAVCVGKDEHVLVGIDSQCDDLIKFLMHDEDIFKQQLKIVSLCGIGGLGKTTVAKLAYRKIENEFVCRAFVSVPPGDDGMITIRSIFDEVHCPCPSSEECDIQQIRNMLREYLQDKKYLIVVDDLWDVSLWDEIKPAFINNNCGSRIITTTRKFDVAEYVGDVYDRLLLSYDDSKKLFYGRTSYGSEDYFPREYREVSERILNKCGLLPLVIIAVTDLLSEKHVLEEWENVCDSIGSGLLSGKAMDDMRRVLKRSYDDLRPDIQKCLVYLRNFSDGCKIRRDNLVRTWISEDLIQMEDHRTLQEVGESYFDKLVNASMIKPIEFDKFGSVVACHVPVMILDLIVSLSVKENSATVIDEGQWANLLQPVQRLSLQVHSKEYNVSKAIKAFCQMSSPFIFCCADLISSRSRFQELRGLHLEKCESPENDDHLKYVWKCVKLRYLALGSTNITVIPEKITKLKHLQTLDLTATSVKQLPASIVKLTQLRHLLINRSTEVPDKILGKLQVLEELVEIDISKCPSILEDISCMRELRVLSIALWSWDEHDGKILSEALCKLSMQKLKHLSIFTCCSLDFSSDVKSILQNVEKLEIQGCTFNKLPPWIIGKEAAVSNLCSLSIEVYSLEKEALRTLGKLSHLLFLSLAAKRIPGEKVVIGRDEFSSLKAFLLFNHDMEIKFEQGAMKKLQRLKLTLQASMTVNFGFGLENLSSLKHVQIEIICFSATGVVFKKAEAEIRSMIGKNPYKPTLEITTVPKFTVDEIEEDLR